MAYPKIYTKNYVKVDDTITVSSGDTVKAKIYDQDSTTQWISSGETSEAGYNTYIEVVFYEGSVATNRLIDTLILLNTNLKDFKLQAYYAAAYHDVLTVTSNALTLAYIGSYTPVTASKIKLLMKATISAGQEKAIGEMMVCSYQFVMTNVLMGHNRADKEMSASYRLADGTLETWWTWTKYALAASIQNVGTALRTSLKTLKDTHDDFIIAPDTDLWIDDYYTVTWTGPWKESYDYKSAAYQIDFSIEAI